MSINKFDKIYNPPIFVDNSKRLEIFNIINTLNTSDLLQYSLINKLSLNQCNDNDDNLIHVVIKMDDKKITEIGKLNIIKFLIQNNVYPDKPNKNNNTPLHLACELQYYHITKYLLDIGVNSNFTDNEGNTPFHYLLTGCIKLVELDNSIKDFIPKTQNRNIKINFTNTFDEILKCNVNNINIMNLSSYQNNNDKFIIYMNDFTNTSLMKSKYNIIINPDIIKLLLNYKANPYVNNIHNISPIHNILKNYNYKIFSELKNIGIDFNRFNSDNPKKFIENEIKNNNDKISMNGTIKTIMQNITESHYNEFKALILNNPRFGNNFLKIFENSFDITAYLTFYILSELLIHTSQSDLITLFAPRGIKVPNKPTNETDAKTGNPLAFNSSHIFEQVGCGVDGKPINIHSEGYEKLKHLLKDKLIEKEKIKGKCTQAEYNIIKQEIDTIKNTLRANGKTKALDINVQYHEQVYLNIWNDYLNTSTLTDRFNYNLLPLYLMDGKKESNALITQLECLCEDYFTNKYNSNNLLSIVYRIILKHQTQLIICYAIKSVLLNIVFNFTSEYEEGLPGAGKTVYLFDYDYFVTTILNYVPTPNNVSINNSFDLIIDKLLINVLNIYSSADDMNTNRTLEVKDILLADIVSNLKVILMSLDINHRHSLFKRYDSNKAAVPGNLNDYDKPINTFINLLENNVVVYFDTIIPKLLISWQSIIENIFKYIINHSRMHTTYNQLM